MIWLTQWLCLKRHCSIALLWDPGYGTWLDRSVVAACDSIEQLGTAVRSLANDESLRRRLSAAGRDWTEKKWSWDATVEAYEDLYADITYTKKKVNAWES